MTDVHNEYGPAYLVIYFIMPCMLCIAAMLHTDNLSYLNVVGCLVAQPVTTILYIYLCGKLPILDMCKVLTLLVKVPLAGLCILLMYKAGNTILTCALFGIVNSIAINVVGWIIIGTLNLICYISYRKGIAEYSEETKDGVQQ